MHSRMTLLREVIWAVFALASVACAKCYDPSPAFPVPVWQKSGIRIRESAFRNLESQLDQILQSTKYDNSSVSIELTSSTNTLWGFYHTARERDSERPGTDRVDGRSQYRIASITKTFTTLAVLKLHAAGKLSLEDPVDKYIPELAGKGGGKIPWKDITIRALASQLSGIPREFGQSELLDESSLNPTELGLPPVSPDMLAPCQRHPGAIICDKAQLLDSVKTFVPLMAPNQKSTYSNLNFELLGLVIENVTGRNYSDHIRETILEPLNMTSSSLEKPSDAHAVLPKGDNYWDSDEGVLSPTGGIYSSSTDLSKFLRYILTHYNALTTGINWLAPASFGEGLNTFYGMPFEILRTDKILQESRRPVTFVNKGGSLPGYYSTISIMPEYGLGFTVLLGANPSLLQELMDVVAVALTQAAEEVVWEDVEKRYTGAFQAVEPTLNSSLVLESSPATGLIVKSFISNGTDVLTGFTGFASAFINGAWRAQLVPTLLFKNESLQQGEIFRILFPSERHKETNESLLDGYCPTDIDLPATYGGLPLNEVVFWHEKGLIELPAWRLTLKAQSKDGFLGLLKQFHLEL